MKGSQFEVSGCRPKRCSACDDVLDGRFFHVSLWVIGDPDWARGDLCPACHDKALSFETTAQGAEMLATDRGGA